MANGTRHAEPALLAVIDLSEAKRLPASAQNLRYPHALGRLACRRKTASRPLSASLSGPAAVRCCLFGGDDWASSSLRSDESFTGRPASWVMPPASSCRQGLPRQRGLTCQSRAADRICNRPDESAGLPCSGPAAQLPTLTASDQHRMLVEDLQSDSLSKADSEARDRSGGARRTPCMFNRVHREKTVPP